MLKNVGSVLQSERAAKRKENSFFLFLWYFVLNHNIANSYVPEPELYDSFFDVFTLDSADSIPLGFRNVSHDYSDLLQAFG